MVCVALAGGTFDSTSTSCAVGIDWMVFGFDPSTTFGRELLATALAAKVSGKTVYAIGNGTCASGNAYNGQSYEGLIGIDLKG